MQFESMKRNQAKQTTTGKIWIYCFCGFLKGIFITEDLNHDDQAMSIYTYLDFFLLQ